METPTLARPRSFCLSVLHIPSSKIQCNFSDLFYLLHRFYLQKRFMTVTTSFIFYCPAMFINKLIKVPNHRALDCCSVSPQPGSHLSDTEILTASPKLVLRVYQMKKMRTSSGKNLLTICRSPSQGYLDSPHRWSVQPIIGLRHVYRGGGQHPAHGYSTWGQLPH